MLPLQGKGDYVDIREKVGNDDADDVIDDDAAAATKGIFVNPLMLVKFTVGCYPKLGLTFSLKMLRNELKVFFALTGKQRKAHKPNSKPKVDTVLAVKEEVEENGGEADGGVMTEEELWGRLDELEKLEELQDEQDRYIKPFRIISCQWDRQLK